MAETVVCVVSIKHQETAGQLIVMLSNNFRITIDHTRPEGAQRLGEIVSAALPKAAFVHIDEVLEQPFILCHEGPKIKGFEPMPKWAAFAIPE